jgi:hypothetical protein
MNPGALTGALTEIIPLTTATRMSIIGIDEDLKISKRNE